MVPLARYLWEQVNGAIPDGMYVCHTCDNGQCVEITHLFLGTHADNMADMKAKDRGRGGHSDQDHCKNGHEWTPENTYRTINHNGRERRHCRKCRSAAVQRVKARKRDFSRGISEDLHE